VRKLLIWRKDFFICNLRSVPEASGTAIAKVMLHISTETFAQDTP
jgi:hypothetical protein